MVNIYAAVTQQPVETVLKEFAGSTFAPFKAALTEALVAHLEPIRTDIAHLLQDRAHLDQLMSQGTDKARTVARATMAQVQDMVGLAKSES